MILPKQYATPVLADKYVQYLQNGLNGLRWLEYVYPAVRVGVDDEGRTYPMVYANDGTDRNYSLLFDTDVRAYSFFEYGGDIVLSEGNFNGGDADMEIPLALVVWGRLDKIDRTKRYDYTSELVKDVVGVIKDVANYAGYGVISLSDLRYTLDYDKVFSRYSLHREADVQSLMRVRTAFRVEFTLRVDSACDID